MATTNINVRVDANLKQSAEALFADLGLKLPCFLKVLLIMMVYHLK